MPAQVLAGPQAAAPTKLSFSGKLIAPKQTNEALIKRIKGIQGELARMEQETVDVRSLKAVAKELVGAALIQHKDASVRASVACCIADVLRLFAPEAPYSVSELKDVFRFFLAQITAALAAKGSTSLSADTIYLLDSLSNVKSIVLIFDLPNAEELMIEYFRRFLGSARADLSKNVEICLADILVHLIDEAETVPQDVLDLLLAVFTPKALKQKVAGHRLAVEVCTATADRMQKEVAKYFVEVITAAVQEEDAEEQQKQFETAHGLIVELNRAVPALLTSVLPQFEEELRAESVPVRQMAVETIGRVLSEKNENAREFPQKWPAVWRSFLQRSTDKVPALRASWLSAARGPLIHHASLKDDITDAMNPRFEDPDERVRLSVIRAIGSLDYETLLHHVPKATLVKLADRALDRKALVQSEALMTMGKVFNKAYSEIERRDASALHQFAWIPSAMAEAGYTTSHGLLALGAAIESQVLPLPEKAQDEAKWINRILVVLKHLTPRAETPFFGFMNLAPERRALLSGFLDSCEIYNGGIGNQDPENAKKGMEWSIRQCATQLGGEKAESDLLSLAKTNDKRLLKLLRTCMDPKQDLQAIIKARAEVKRRVQETSAELAATVSAFLRSGSFFIINRSAVPLLARRLQPGEVDYSSTQQDVTQSQDGSPASRSASASTTFQEFKILAQKVLHMICKQCPAMLVPYADDFVRATGSAKDNALSEISLQALAAILVEDGQAITIDRRFVERCGRFIKDGTPMQAKYAAQFLANACCDPDGPSGKSLSVSSLTKTLATRTLDQLLEELAVGLAKASDQDLVRHLRALGQCFKRAPKLSDNVAESVIRAIVGVVLPRKWKGAADEPVAANGDWTTDEGIHPWLQAKVLGISLLTKRCAAAAKKASSVDMVKPVMRLLWQTLVADESTSEDIPSGHLARLRLAAAISLVKLARFPTYEALIGSEFVNLAFIVQDVCFGVRLRFLRKVLTYMTRRRLPSRFNVIGFLSAVDPEAENKNSFTLYVSSAVNSMPEESRFLFFDIAFTRFLHMLAHHPDFDRQAGPEELGDFVAYIDFYLATLVTSENIGLYFHLASKLKTVRDKETSNASDNLYALSEFAQLLIKRRAKAMGWTIDTYPGKVKLPSDIFAPLPSPEIRNEVYSHQYLPAETIQWLTESSKPIKNKVPRAAVADTPKKRKATEATRPKPRQKRRRSTKNKNTDSDEDIVRASDSDSDSEDDGDKDSGDERVSDMEEEIDLSKDAADGRSARLREKQAREIQERNERRKQKLTKLAGAAPTTSSGYAARDSKEDDAGSE